MQSENYKNWIAILDLKTCKPCRRTHGQIYEMDEIAPLHRNCRCEIEAVEARLAGTCTLQKQNGADWMLKHLGKLPDYYILPDDAKRVGWDAKLGNLASVCPGKMLLGGIYQNRNGHLPAVDGRNGMRQISTTSQDFVEGNVFYSPMMG